MGRENLVIMLGLEEATGASQIMDGLELSGKIVRTRREAEITRYRIFAYLGTSCGRH